ncbi:hypothetical protein ABZ897_21995 [Nonomuraea sp. NPDC046802]|uniref:hypothetical protein n=1 Tax=Nonomuraea sp. NPDC046802 TaxID=3154919 RepID=UPI0033F234AF
MGRLTAHWAILGKTPESLDDYGVVGCSTGAITSGEFGTWLKAFTSGTMEPKALPRVATSHFTAGPDAEPWLGLSLQVEPESQDGFQRPYAMTYYVCARWADTVAEPVSYRALFEALLEENFSGQAPFQLSPAAYDVRRLAGEVNATARRAAALLLTGRPVCVVGADHLLMEQRLDFLDAVAAMLPYGFRATLAVSTWTNSASIHRIRLSFSDVPPTHKTWELPWEADAPAEYPPQAQLYEKELARYQGEKLGELMSWLATLTEPRDFENLSHRTAAASMLRGGRPHQVARQSPMSVQDLLRECRESIANGDDQRLGALNAQLARRAPARVTDRERKACRAFIRANPIHPPNRPAAFVAVRTFYEQVLRLLYVGRMSASDVEDMLLDLDPELSLPPALVAALGKIQSHSALSGRLLLANLRGPEHVQTVLAPMSEDELCHTAIESRNRNVLSIALQELDRRALPEDPRGMEAVKHALTRHRYLIETIASICDAAEGVRAHRDMFWMSYRRQLTSADIEEILPNLDRPPQTFLLAMVVESAPGTAPALLRAAAAGAMREQGLIGTPTADDVQGGLDRMATPEDAFNRMAAPEDDGGGRKRWFRRRPPPVVGKILIGASIAAAVVAASLTVWLWLWR